MDGVGTAMYDLNSVPHSIKKRLYDAIVVGAGPAGNLAAHRLAEAGHSVAVIDWRRNIGDKLCTGIIGRECRYAYPPDDGHIYRAAASATVVAPSGRTFTIKRESPQAYIIDRVAYVASIAANAERAGARFELGHRVSSIDVDREAVTVRTTDEGGSHAFRARVLVVASGFGSPVVAMAGLDNGGGTFMTGSQVEVTVRDVEETRVYLGSKVVPGSFGWVVPFDGSRALVGLVTRRRLNGHMSGFVSALRSNGVIEDVMGAPQKWGIPVRPLGRTYGERVVVVGDAAGLAKPITGGGIYYALISGELAAQTLGAALETDDLSARSMKAYERAWKSKLGRELRIGYLARLMYEALGDRQIEFLLAELMADGVRPDLVDSEDVSFDWHSGFIKRALSHRTVGRLLWALKSEGLHSVAGTARSLAG